MIDRFPSGYVDPGNQLTARCVTDAANPSVRIQWKRNNVLLADRNQYATIQTFTSRGKYNAMNCTSILYVTAGLDNNGINFECFAQDAAQNLLLKAGPTSFLIGKYIHLKSSVTIYA